MAIGPCLLAAPVVAVAAVVAIPLWPVSIVVLGVAWLVVWPVERTLVAFGITDRARASPLLGRWFGFALKPWKFFELPPPKA